MLSTLKKSSFFAVGSLALLAGCQQAYQSQADTLNQTPIVEDEAMVLRQWSQSSAMIPNGATVAGPTFFEREPRPGQEEWRYYYADTATYAGNMLMLPYRMWKTPVKAEVVYPGVVIPPSHTAVPATPDSPATIEPPSAPEAPTAAEAAAEPAPPTPETAAQPTTLPSN